MTTIKRLHEIAQPIFTAEVYIMHGDEVLMFKRSETKKKFPGFWSIPGGHIDEGEDPLAAAIREVKEETALDIELIGNPKAGAPNTDEIREILPPKFFNRHFVDPTHTHEHVDFVYFGRAYTRDARMENNVEYHWLTSADIEGNKVEIPEDVKTYARIALRELADS